jgi:hypothetical protein
MQAKVAEFFLWLKMVIFSVAELVGKPTRMISF